MAPVAFGIVIASQTVAVVKFPSGMERGQPTAPAA